MPPRIGYIVLYKMLFEGKKNADNFIHFNQDTILEESGKAPVRCYYAYSVH